MSKIFLSEDKSTEEVSSSDQIRCKDFDRRKVIRDQRNILENPQKVKPLLYVYRVLLTGIHLMQTGIIEANLVKLNEKFQLSYLDELITKKTTEAEKSTLKDTQIDFYYQEYERLQKELEIASQNSHLPETSSAKPELNDLLVRIRLLS